MADTMMTAPDVVEWLMNESARSSAVQPALFRALLDTTMYVRVPISAGAEYGRFATYRSPDDGTDVVPVFTDHARAKHAAKGNAHIVAINGRTFFVLTRGATVAINPNDTQCVLYPEDIDRLLDGRTIPSVQTYKVKGEDGPQFFKPDAVSWVLLQALNAALRQVGGVETAYVAEARWGGSSPFEGLLIALAGERAPGDRRARAVAMALEDVMFDSHMSVAVTQFGASMPPVWMTRLDLKPVYWQPGPEKDGRRLSSMLPRT